MFRLLIALLALATVLPGSAQDAEVEAPAEPANYTVQHGDTLYDIARRFALPLDDLLDSNDIDHDSTLEVGTTLTIPPLDESRYLRHLVKSGDTLYAIARVHATTQEALRNLNLMAADDSLRVGQIMLVPLAPPIPRKPDFGFGLHVFIDGAADNLAAQVSELGVASVKIDVAWSNIEAQPGEYDFGDLDALVRALDAAGVFIMLNIYDAPDWSRENYRATLNSALTDYGGPPDDLADFADFLVHAAARYVGIVDAYEIWKAPNLVKYWNAPVYEEPPQRDEDGEYGLPDSIAMGAAHYIELLQSAYAAIKAQDPSAQVITAGLAPVGYTDNYNTIGTDIFLAELLALGADDFADGIGAVFSASAVPPAIPCCAQPPGVESHYESFIQNFSALLAHYAEAMGAHAVDMPLVATQVGWGTAEGANLAIPATGFEWLNYTSQEEQALYVRQAFQLAQGMDKLESMYLHNLNGCAVGDEEACFFSLVDAGGARRPAFDAYAALPKSAGDSS